MSVDDTAQDSRAPSPGKPRGVLGRIPHFVWLTTFTMFVLLLLGTLILPQLIIPDEKHHADMVLMAEEGEWITEGWPGPGERRLDSDIVDASLSLGPREKALRENRAAQHPPLFYVATALTSSLVTLPDDNPDLTLDLWAYRLISVFAVAALPVTFFLIASELTANRWISMATAVVPLTIPGITLRVGPMINTDALLIFLTSISVLLAIRVAKGDLTKRTGIGIGLATGLAALTKGHALLVIPVIAVAYLIALYRDRLSAREWLQSLALSGGISLLVGGWWWIRNLVLYGALQPLREMEAANPPVLDWSEWLFESTRRLVVTFWGGGFALGGNSYTALFWILTTILVLGCVVGWVRSKDRVISSVSVLLGLLLIPAVYVTAALFYEESGNIRAVQGRYFFPGLAGVAPLVVLSVAGIADRAIRWLPAIFVTASGAMTLLSIRYMFNRYWTEPGSGWGDRLSEVVTSSPFPNAFFFGLVILNVVAFLTLLASAVFVGSEWQLRNVRDS